jgi:hypothetical protein
MSRFPHFSENVSDNPYFPRKNGEKPRFSLCFGTFLLDFAGVSVYN